PHGRFRVQSRFRGDPRRTARNRVRCRRRKSPRRCRLFLPRPKDPCAMMTTSLQVPTARRQSVIRVVLTRPLGSIGALIIVAFAVSALLAPVISPYDPNQQDLLNA